MALTWISRWTVQVAQSTHVLVKCGPAGLNQAIVSSAPGVRDYETYKLSPAVPLILPTQPPNVTQTRLHYCTFTPNLLSYVTAVVCHILCH